MCQAKIWIKVGNEEREYVKDITQLEIKGEEVWLKSFFEPPQKLKGKVTSVDFLKGKVIIECEAFPG
ncbi:MAG: CooT family nickel-binding protein [Caldimicrobium sp.]|nr:CooT family nickel-binding protein [Caldimicrobium sp.]MCX7613211.1 CooT family nickel-binding protein [Caldimicrobium sp.]MDW8182487.1 CooT family nickel-binding protein [Caldimicrobium sp.]